MLDAGFVDDEVLFAAGRSPGEALERGQKLLDIVSEEFTACGLVINYKKGKTEAASTFRARGRRVS